MEQIMSEFDNWYKGDLIYDEICDECIPPEMLRKWMMACWNAAIETSSEHIRYMNVEFIDDVANDILTLKIS